MFKTRIILALFLVISITSATAAEKTEVSPTYWDTPEGIQRLNHTLFYHPFTALLRYFVTQKNTSYCGPASAVMIANALHIPSPTIRGLTSGSLWTQETIFTPPVIQAGITPELVSRQGVTLEEETQLLNTIPGVLAIAHHVSKKTTEIRKQLIAAVSTPNQHLLINYIRPKIDQKGYGHFSAAAAYDKATDSILILDVARYKYPPF